MRDKLFRILTSLVISLAFALAGFNPALAAAPANDSFSNTEVITSLPFSTTTDISEAGLELDEPQQCYFMDRTVWYSFTPTETMTVRADAHGGTVNGNVNIYRSAGSGISGLEFLNNCTGRPDGSPAFLAEAGQTYYLQAGSVFGEVGNMQVSLEQIFPPANDNFANAEAIPSLPFNSTADIKEATIEPSEPQNCSNFSDTVWYSFTPTVNAVVSADMAGSNFGDAILNIYQDGGSGIGSLSFLQCAYYGNSATFSVQAGTVYYVQVGSINSGGGDLHVNLHEIPPPPNDNFANATTIAALPFNDSVDSTAASRETNEPYDCNGSRYTVWYAFTALDDGVIRADMAGSSFGDTQLSVYQATGPGFGGLSFVNCGVVNSVDFSVKTGTTYYLQAGSLSSFGGNLHVNLQEIPTPANDNFAAATSISSLPSTIDFDTSAATFESNEPPTCGYPSPPYKTIWFAFTAVQTGSISASIPMSSNFAPFLAIYSGTGFNNLTQLGCGQFSNKVTVHVVQGKTYYIQVGGYYSEGGSGQFLLENAPAPQANFYFYPGDPSKYDTIQFCSSSNDPGNVGIQSFTWDFGDGATSTEGCVTHRYTADGDYTVQHTVTTFDGRTAPSTPQVVHVRTHDVAITKITAPNSANVGQSKTITVTLRNVAYPETVQIDLYKSTANGFVLIGSVTVSVPALSGNRTTAVNFSYKFTSDDAKLGKVTFKAVATIVGARDAYPSDNEAFSSITKVAK